MGFLQERFGMSIIGKTPPGTCPMCAAKHEPHFPHNRDSLAYQYQFYDQHGSWPTWADAIDHCPENIKEYWKQALRNRGVEIGEVTKDGES